MDARRLRRRAQRFLEGGAMTPELFRCVRLDCRLTRESCARRHLYGVRLAGKSALVKTVPAPEAVRVCSTCPIGRSHAAEVAT
jgi:hypothetical protein